MGRAARDYGSNSANANMQALIEHTNVVLVCFVSVCLKISWFSEWIKCSLAVFSPNDDLASGSDYNTIKIWVFHHGQ